MNMNVNIKMIMNMNVNMNMNMNMPINKYMNNNITERNTLVQISACSNISLVSYLTRIKW
jgi:hypothetical protein